MTEIAESQTPPILHGPSEKERKYDRQLRLWAASGQAALESANLFVVNSGCGTVVTETLKNLILPGIGQFTIYDEATVEEADLGVNFFLDDDSLGKPRAQSCTELLLELNSEVQGDWRPKPEDKDGIKGVLDGEPSFTMILYSQPIKRSDLTLLEDYAKEHHIPLLAVHSAGFYSFFRMDLPGAFPVVDTHPDESATTDLRLLQPWPELVEFAKELTADIDNLDNHLHGHLPYIAILLHYLETWRESHDDKNPLTYAEKKAFREVVKAAARTNNPEGVEENFDEAAAAVLRNVELPSLPSGLKAVFDHKPQGAETKSGFWIIAKAIEQFYEKHKSLPLPGRVPDMKAQSAVYIKLQTIYKNKARKDAAEVLETIRSLPGGEHVDATEVELFCKNAAFVKLINAAPVKLGHLTKVIEEELANDANADPAFQPLSLAPIYLALQATAFLEKATEEEILENIDRLVWGASKNERVATVAKELARVEGAEQHNISALTGGMVAQEMIKIITKQYVPIDNTCIFDGISSRSQVLRL